MADPQDVRKTYNRMALAYAFVEPFERRLMRRGVEALGIRPGERVLEVGCGRGYSASLLAERTGPQGEVYLADISDRMLKAAQSRLRKRGMADRARFYRGDARHLPCENNRFDAAFFSFSLELIDDLEGMLAELRRVLKQEGRVGVVSLADSGWNRETYAVYGWLHKRFPSLIGCKPMDMKAKLEHCGYHIGTREKHSCFTFPVDIIIARP